MTELVKLTAREAIALLRRGEVSPLELVDTAAARIESVDGAVNALPIRCFERARDQAKAMLNARREADERPGWLFGLPVAIKDLNRVAGVRTTWGSPVFADHVPERSDFGVETLEKNGAIVIAKSNVPELGPGANTSNAVFGQTRNPWNTDLTSGGSSGGAAVGVATGQVWLANGSDGGCSLRIPASFCSVATIRPTPGRVAWGSTAPLGLGPKESPWETLEVEGPIGRTVADVALMLDAQVGAHPRDPRSMPRDETAFLTAVDRPELPKRVAFSRDLGGITPVATEVGDICAAAARQLETLGVTVEEACPDLSDAREAYHVLRSHSFVITYGPLVETYRADIKQDVVWNYEEGAKLTSGQIAKAEHKRAEILHRMADFFSEYDMLLCPSACTPPFDVNWPALMELEGHSFEHYYDWYTICFAISLTACPTMSVPCGFTSTGLPVGLQLVGPFLSEARLLGAAKLLEDTFGIACRVPMDPIPGPVRAGADRKTGPCNPRSTVMQMPTDGVNGRQHHNQ